MEILAAFWFTWTVIFCNSALAAESESGYVFTSPRYLKTGAYNQMQLRRFGKMDAGELKVKITYMKSSDPDEKIAAEEIFEVQEGEVDTIMKVYLKPVENYIFDAKISINGKFGEYAIEGSEKIYFSFSRDVMVFIETDKPLYKEGQIVKFRVLRVDKTLRPIVRDNADIWIEDPAGTRLLQWRNVSMGKGMRQFEFPLADEPMLGYWKICASFQGERSTINFEVKEYVLPTFDVKIIPPPFALLNAEEIPIKICAKYTYGKPVQGNLRLNASLERLQWREWKAEKLSTIEYEDKIDGCLEYTVNVSRFDIKDHNRYSLLKVVANVEETGTGVEKNETKYIHRQNSPLILNFNLDQKRFYKPGLPYNGKLFVKYPDDSPAHEEDIQICYSVNEEKSVLDGQWKGTRTLKCCRNYTSDENGVIEFVIPQQNTESTGISVEAKSVTFAKKYQKMETDRKNSLTEPYAISNLTPWFSSSGSFIQIQVQEILLCETRNNIKVLFTSKSDKDYTFFYQVFSQGKVVQKGSVEESFSVKDDVSNQYEDADKVINGVYVQNTSSFDSFQTAESPKSSEEICKSSKEKRHERFVGEIDIELHIDPSWSPSFHLLVYYIRDDREIVADSQKFKVEECFKNKVKLEFGDDVKQPGTKTTIKVTSAPNSLCGIKVTDKSISLLDSENQLTPEKVFRFLENSDNGMSYGINHCNDEVRQPGLPSSSRYSRYAPRGWAFSLYADSLAAFENAGFLVISNFVLFTRPCKTTRPEPGGFVPLAGSYGPSYPTRLRPMRPSLIRPVLATTPSAVATSTAVPVPSMPASDKRGEASTKSVVDVRDYFPESWLFDLELTEEDGVFQTKKKLPHTVTEWIGSAVCINDEDGLGISNTTSIKGFQAFFLTTTLPYSVIRGESFWITISLFSYVEDPLPVKITLDEFEGFAVISDSIDGDICIQPGSGTNLKVQLKGTALGSNNITVRAESVPSSDVCGSERNFDTVAKDAIRKSVIVEAEGWPVEDVESILFCPEDEENKVFKKSLSLKEPEDVVLDSSRAYLDVTGNVLGKSIDNLENLVTLPTGCGEQNMVKFAPNVVVMDTLISTNQLTEEMKTRIIRNLNTGAQRQMNYKHPDGSYSAFGAKDKEGSMFLTAFVLRYFAEAAKYITIDNTTITQMQNWIISKQKDDGCFPDIGKILDRSLQGSIEKDKGEGTITAYVLASLLISDYQNQTVLEKALSCLSNTQDTSFYSIFLSAYAESLAGKEDSVKERLQSVKGRGIQKGKMLYYHDTGAGKSQDVETAAYAVMTVLKSGGSASDALPIVQYLTQNMSPRGGFYSTQDTCVGLEALGQFSKMTFKDSVNIFVKIEGGLQKEIQITEDEKLLVKRHKVNEIPSEISIEGKGTGCALLQKIFRYNIKTSPEKRNFELETAGKCFDDECKKAIISMSFSYLPEGKKSGMTVAEIKMVSGMSPIKESLKQVLEDEQSNLMRYDVENNNVVLYFNEVTNEKMNLSFEVEKVVEVENSQPGTVKLYDYYTTDISSSNSYSFCEKPASCSVAL